MTDRNLTMLTGNEEGLRLANGDLASSGIPNVANRAGTWQTIKSGLIERVCDVSHCSFQAEFYVVRTNNSA
jgi:hypothetical protein